MGAKEPVTIQTFASFILADLSEFNAPEFPSGTLNADWTLSGRRFCCGETKRRKLIGGAIQVFTNC